MKQEFVDAVKSGKVLAKNCTKCSHLHLATVYFCQNCGAKGFENEILNGTGTVATYTIPGHGPATTIRDERRTNPFLIGE